MEVSVVMSCYNSEKYVVQAIESILNQTFTDFEFIIWNDGSTDRTEEIIKSYADERIRYFYHENTGLGMALKLACQKARGEYIARMDADDIALPERLSAEYLYLTMHPDVVLVSSAVYYINDAGKTIGRSFPYTKDRIIKKLLQCGYNAITHPCSMFRKDVYLKAEGYLPLKKAQDLNLFSRMSKFGKMVNLSIPYLKYRIAENSISTQTDGTPYSLILHTYLIKMANDTSVNETDIDIYNQLVVESKKIKGKDIKAMNISRYCKLPEEILFDLLKPFVGEKSSTAIVVFIKNILGRTIYKHCNAARSCQNFSKLTPA